MTIINIICIIVTGWAILRLKEVTPKKIPQQFSTFWTNDVKVHRDYLSTLSNKKGGMTLVDEVRGVLGTSQSKDEDLEGTFLQTLFEKVEQDAKNFSYKMCTLWRDSKVSD